MPDGANRYRPYSFESAPSNDPPPSNLMAERALLGAILANNKAYEPVSGYLLPEHFAEPINGRIYRAISDRIDAGRLADSVSLKADFENSGVLDDFGGVEYLTKLLTSMVGIINAKEYGRVVHEAWAKRKLIEVASEITSSALGGDDNVGVSEQLAEADGRIGKLSESFFCGTNSNSIPISVAAERAIERSKKALDNGGFIGYRTGFQSLDRILGGLEGGAVYCVAGRPGMAKTSCLLQASIGLARTEGVAVQIFSLEMSSEQIMNRSLSMETSIPLSEVRSGGWSDPDRSPPSLTQDIGDAAHRLGKLPIEIDDQGGLTIEAMISRCRATRRKYKSLGLVAVDHLHLISAPKSRGTDTENTTAISLGLKRMSKVLGCPVLVAVQLNRKCEERENKRPLLSDLRQSGSIEQDAESVIFLYREAYYKDRERPSHEPGQSTADYEAKLDQWTAELAAISNQGEWIVSKNRNGPLATIRMEFEPTRTEWAEPWGAYP